MGKTLASVFIFLFISQQSWTANLYFINKEATFSKDEKIISVLVHNKSMPSVSLHSKNMSCTIVTSTIDEAYKIQDSLNENSNNWIQCYGVHTSPYGTNSIYIETDNYSLGKQLDK